MTAPAFELRFEPGELSSTRRRITYAFSLFAFTYGYRLAASGDVDVAVVGYGNVDADLQLAKGCAADRSVGLLPSR